MAGVHSDLLSVLVYSTEGGDGEGIIHNTEGTDTEGDVHSLGTRRGKVRSSDSSGSSGFLTQVYLEFKEWISSQDYIVQYAKWPLHKDLALKM